MSGSFASRAISSVAYCSSARAYEMKTTVSRAMNPPGAQRLSQIPWRPAPTGSALLDLGVRGGGLGEQRGQLFLRLAPQRFEALVQRRGSRNLLLSHVALALAEEAASVEGS